jgi:hypothetical protein
LACTSYKDWNCSIILYPDVYVGRTASEFGWLVLIVTIIVVLTSNPLFS